VLKVIATKVQSFQCYPNWIGNCTITVLLIVRYHTVIYDTMRLLHKKFCGEYERLGWKNISWSITWTRNCQSV